MLIRAFSFLALAAIALSLVGCGGGRAKPAPGPVDDLNRIRQEQVLRVGVKADTPPFGFRIAGNLSGFDVDLVNALATRMGVRLVNQLILVGGVEGSERIVAPAALLLSSTLGSSNGRHPSRGLRVAS